MELSQVSASWVALRVDSFRPMRMILLAPARQKERAVARPMPLPWTMLMREGDAMGRTYCAGDEDGFAGGA